MKYILKKEIPGFKKGDIFVPSQSGEGYHPEKCDKGDGCSPYCIVLVNKIVEDNIYFEKVEESKIEHEDHSEGFDCLEDSFDNIKNHIDSNMYFLIAADLESNKILVEGHNVNKEDILKRLMFLTRDLIKKI